MHVLKKIGGFFEHLLLVAELKIISALRHKLIINTNLLLRALETKDFWIYFKQIML
jgi:hypothetical protein